MPIDWLLRVAVLSTVLWFVIGLGLAHLLSSREFRGKRLVEAALQLPLALPPAVLLYYILSKLGWLTFSWQGAVAASLLYSAPLLTKLARAAIEGVDHRYARAARTLGASEWRTFWRVALPLARPQVAAASALVFARALADIGITLLIASKAR